MTKDEAARLLAEAFTNGEIWVLDELYADIKKMKDLEKSCEVILNGNN